MAINYVQNQSALTNATKPSNGTTRGSMVSVVFALASNAALTFPRITSHAAVLLAQRSVPTSITSPRHSLSYHLLAHTELCSCCGRASETLHL